MVSVENATQAKAVDYRVRPHLLLTILLTLTCPRTEGQSVDIDAGIFTDRHYHSFHVRLMRSFALCCTGEIRCINKN